MIELWERAAALCETRHQIVMALLGRALAAPNPARARGIFAAIDRINTIVDEIDKTNPETVSRVHDMLTGGLVQLQRGRLSEPAGSARQPATAYIER